MLFTGYIKNNIETKKVLTKQGATVGDLGYKNDEGRIFLVGRESNMIKSGGLKVYPEEVESILQSHPNIAECIVFSKPDTYWGEKVVCSIHWKNENQQLSMKGIKSFCENKLASYKIPKDILEVPTFKYTKSGKVDRKATLNEVKKLISI